MTQVLARSMTALPPPSGSLTGLQHPPHGPYAGSDRSTETLLDAVWHFYLASAPVDDHAQGIFADLLGWNPVHLFINVASSSSGARCFHGLEGFAPQLPVDRRQGSWSCSLDRLSAPRVAVTPEAAALAQPALDRIRHLATLKAGWDGTDRAAPVADAVRDAKALTVAFVLAGVHRRPRIGADSDGSISFLFMEGEEPLADLSVFGDGTYSFYAERGETSEISDGTPVGGPIPAGLLAILKD